MVYLTSNSSTLSCDNGDRPSVTVTVTNWDESRSGDKGILETPSLSDHQEQTIIEEQREDRSQSENGSRFNISVADCHHLQVPGRPTHATRLKSAKKDLDPGEVELVHLPSHQLLDAGALLRASCAKDVADPQVPFHLILHPAIGRSHCSGCNRMLTFVCPW